VAPKKLRSNLNSNQQEVLMTESTIRGQYYPVYSTQDPKYQVGKVHRSHHGGHFLLRLKERRFPLFFVPTSSDCTHYRIFSRKIRSDEAEKFVDQVGTATMPHRGATFFSIRLEFLKHPLRMSLSPN
jgi:hypothetical protein